MKSYTKYNPYKMTKQELFNHIRHVTEDNGMVVSGWLHGNGGASDLVECHVSEGGAKSVSTHVRVIGTKELSFYCERADDNVRQGVPVVEEVCLYDYVEKLINLLADHDIDIFNEDGGLMLFNFGMGHASWEVKRYVPTLVPTASLSSHPHENESKETK